MKKLAALASMAVLLCASAGFAKQAMDEEEMDLVTAAGQPSVIIVEVETSGFGELNSTAQSSSAANGTINAPAAGATGSLAAQTDPTAFEANIGLALGELSVPLGLLGTLELENAVAALNLDYADADIETFTLSITGTATGTLTATASAAATSSVSGASASVTAISQDTSTTNLLVASGSQTNLRAVVLNNVAGENQLANALNIQSGVLTSSTSQTNTITQSWGSTYDWSFAPGVAATATASATGGTISADQSMSPCILVAGDCNANSVSTSAVATAATSPAVPLTITADKILQVGVESSGDAVVDVSELNKAVVVLTVDTGSQSNLAAIVVNNVVGKNQVASAINISSGGAVVIGSEAFGAAVVARVQFDGNVGGNATLTGSQANTISQYRGTPAP